MSSSQPDSTELQDKLKSSLWFSIGRLCDSESARLQIAATPQFKGSLTEMVWAQIESVATDLETFARHAGRTTVTTEDVLLVCRRNEALRGIIGDFVDGEKADGQGGEKTKSGKGRGRPKKGD